MSEKLPRSMPIPQHSQPRIPRLADSQPFVDFMAKGWDSPQLTAPVDSAATQAAANHRENLSQAFTGQGIMVFAGQAPVRANDNFHEFRANSDFMYLINAQIETAVLLGHPTTDGHDFELFIPVPFAPGTADFFSNAIHGELWVGPSHKPLDWQRALGIPVRPIQELESAVRSGHFHAAGAVNATELGTLNAQDSPSLKRVLSQLRMVKDAWEIAELRASVNHTIDGFAQVLNEIPHAIRFGGERWLQGTFDRVARTYGNGPGYATIIGAGIHAPTLHWTRCDGPVSEDQLLLLDMGVEERSCYTADVTRTFPVAGTFTEAQRQVHDLVEKSHRAGLAALAPGKAYSDFHFACMEEIAKGLHDWGLLPVSVDEALSPTGQHHRRWLVCGVGHHLGLDVHDCSHSHYEDYQGALLQENMVLTVEPGLYFHAHDTMVPPELRGLGVRIEDDLLITATGYENLSAELPLDAAGLERWMAQAMNPAVRA
ncbi:aminopeptidase P N-terminal domain-containing protein [Glutamicibacter sp. NPDC087344]|uniref:aminopeptidase P N-terminal domain-containing protein n=1 Tax=Glutamicibacter sp. NPDC087344 TaxID=3363994 RepID=UPI00382D5413